MLRLVVTELRCPSGRTCLRSDPKTAQNRLTRDLAGRPDASPITLLANWLTFQRLLHADPERARASSEATGLSLRVVRRRHRRQNGILKRILTRSRERGEIFAGKALAAVTYTLTAVVVMAGIGLATATTAGCARKRNRKENVLESRALRLVRIARLCAR